MRSDVKFHHLAIGLLKLNRRSAQQACGDNRVHCRVSDDSGGHRAAPQRTAVNAFHLKSAESALSVFTTLIAQRRIGLAKQNALYGGARMPYEIERSHTK